MNEIRNYRGKTINGEWVYGLVAISTKKIHNRPKEGVYISNRGGSPFAFQVRPEIIDIHVAYENKNPIDNLYVNDIVRVGKHVAVIKYDEYRYHLEPEYEPKSLFELIISGKLEKLGNIHDNPELLKELKL